MISNEIDQGMTVILCDKLKIVHFPHIFFEHGYLAIYIILTDLNMFKHTGKTHLEGSVSQNVDIGLRFYFRLFRRHRNFEKIDKNIPKLPVFSYTITNRA